MRLIKETLSILVLSILPFYLLPSLIWAQTNNSTAVSSAVFPLDSNPYGLSYQQWSTKWWQWAYSLPAENNPILDKTGKDCAQMQSGPVWFLAGTSGGSVERSCNIPSNNAIFFPIINTFCPKALNPDYSMEEIAKGCPPEGPTAKANIVEASLDGQALQAYRVQSQIFNITLPKNNILGAPEGVTEAVSDGYWILLEPLSIGQHEIHFRGSALDVTETSTTNFVTEASYHLTVSNTTTAAAVTNTTASTEQLSNTTTTSITPTINTTAGTG
jgi:hypothetical protein